MITRDFLKQRQGLPLEAKIVRSQQKIREWNDHWHGQTYVAFSGGKDSTVLLDLVREFYPNTPAVFVDTGLEYPEIKDFVKTIPNVVTIRPKMSFKEVLDRHGYPVVSKEQARYINDCQNSKPTNAITCRRRLTGIDRFGVQKKSGMISKKWLKLIDSGFKVSEKCCDEMKKKPISRYERETGQHSFVGVMASDSYMRTKSYIKTGCNSFDTGKSQPMGFWLEQDVWNYIKLKNLPYSKIYDMGATRTGCMFCMFGVHLEKHPNRFENMKNTHPQLWDYCINKLGCGKVLDFIGVSYGA